MDKLYEMVYKTPRLKDLDWVGSAKRDLKSFPSDICSDFGFQLDQEQRGRTPPNSKPLKGCNGADVRELTNKDSDSTFRVVYTVQFDDIIYVLHAFQKKSKKGIETPQHEIDLVAARLKQAIAMHSKRGNQK